MLRIPAYDEVKPAIDRFLGVTLIGCRYMAAWVTPGDWMRKNVRRQRTFSEDAHRIVMPCVLRSSAASASAVNGLRCARGAHEGTLTPYQFVAATFVVAHHWRISRGSRTKTAR